MEDREEGFYWVRTLTGKWTVALWNGEVWYGIGTSDSWEHDLGGIGPRIPKPAK